MKRLQACQVGAISALVALSALSACVGDAPEGEVKDIDDLSEEAPADETESTFAALPAGLVAYFNSNTPTNLANPWVRTYWPGSTWPTLYMAGGVSNDFFVVSAREVRPGRYDCDSYTNMYRQWVYNGRTYRAKAGQGAGGFCTITINSYGLVPGQPITGTYYGYLNNSGILSYVSGSFNIPRGPELWGFGISKTALSGCDSPRSPPYSNCGTYDATGRSVCYCTRASRRVTEAFFTSSSDLLHWRSVYPTAKIFASGPTPYTNSRPFWIKQTW